MKDDVMAFIVGIVIGLVFGFLPTQMVSEYKVSTLRSEAVKAGHAEWVVDSYGHNEFKWKTK